MLVELRNVHFSERMSEETNCFSAMVYIDGKKAGEVRNHGTGGPDEFSFDTKDLEAYAATLPPLATDYGTMKMNAELLVGDLFEEWLKKKEQVRMTKGRTTFHLKDDKEGEFRTIKVPFSPEMKAKVLAKYGDKVEFFLNEEAEGRA